MVFPRSQHGGWVHVLSQCHKESLEDKLLKCLRSRLMVSCIRLLAFRLLYEEAFWYIYAFHSRRFDGERSFSPLQYRAPAEYNFIPCMHNYSHSHSIMHFVLSPFRKSWHFEAGMLDVVCLAWNLRVIPFPGVAGPVISPWRQCNRLFTWSWKMEANAAFGLVSPPDGQLLVCLYWPRLLFVSKWRGNLMGSLETRGPSGERSQCTSFERWIDSIS